jgi:hypothetical protein
MPTDGTDWDTDSTDTIDAFRGVILDACGVSVISAAAELQPNGVINPS